jgi:hypothetical protein
MCVNKKWPNSYPIRTRDILFKTVSELSLMQGFFIGGFENWKKEEDLKKIERNRENIKKDRKQIDKTER